MLQEKEENELINKLSEYQGILKESVREYKPSHLARYLLDLCQLFNNFYEHHQVLKADKEIRHARLTLIKAVAQVLENGLNLLGIDAPKEM